MSLVPPIERHFREAKDTQLWLTNLTTSAERGNRIDFYSAKNRVENVLVLLDQIALGSAPIESVSPPPPPPFGVSSPSVSSPSSSGAVNPVLVPQNISSYSSIRSPAKTTELQRRKAETLATELRQMRDHLCRLHLKNEENAQFAEKKKQLLGDNFNGANRTEFSEMQMQQKERESLQHLKKRFAFMEEESSEVLQALRTQGGRLGRSKKGVESVLDSLGFSNTVMGQIVRRNRMDAYIVYGGIVILLFVMWKMWSR